MRELIVTSAVFVQESVPDRTGFHYAMLSLAAWPSLLLTVSDIWRDKDVVSRDIDDRLYSRACHTLSQVSERSQRSAHRGQLTRATHTHRSLADLIGRQ